ncbi:hypothetical protein EUTSA_v10014267mg [Eutrema salsugineum]|uniref:Phytocyanin domain-containing protein n=1 Tax=Eutrema salsugineum TaxID=72664 RepID=V4LHB5_EUTSA|nr:early nodulin-like protein 2 [Eutrema salsugineum]ESQ43104.1 hypothetical protein EUTSA_v10014267mg [Eutrema salsugineum]
MVSITQSLCFSFIILSSFATLFSVTDARRFYVGDNGVWAVHPHESYNTWAERNRFQVNDTLYFKFTKGSDSVQRVMDVDYHACNVGNPLQNFVNGEAEIALNRSGPFFFISGNQDHCLKGLKLIVVVLAIRYPPAAPISPAKPPKSHSPVSPIPPAKAPSTAQTPKSHSPVSPIAPAKAPKSTSPVSPANSPSKSQPPKSSVSPSHAPKSPSPSTSSPASSPTSSPSPDESPDSQAPEQSSPLSPSPSESTPSSGNVTSPPPGPRNAAGGVAVTSVMSSVLSVVFTFLMFG